MSEKRQIPRWQLGKEGSMKLEGYSWEGNCRIEDMNLSQEYNGIIIALGSFQLFYPREAAFNVLKVLKKHLAPDGKGKLLYCS